MNGGNPPLKAVVRWAVSGSSNNWKYVTMRSSAPMAVYDLHISAVPPLSLTASGQCAGCIRRWRGRWMEKLATSASCSFLCCHGIFSLSMFSFLLLIMAVPPLAASLHVSSIRIIICVFSGSGRMEGCLRVPEQSGRFEEVDESLDKQVKKSNSM